MRNTINGALGVVVKTAGENITIQPVTGERITFRAQYLAQASEAEASSLAPLIARLKKEEEDRNKPKPSEDPVLIRAAFEKFMRHIAVRYPKAEQSFREFWNEIMAVTGDAPVQTWEMRPSSVKYPCPIIKVCSNNKWVYLLYLQAGWDLRMEIKKEFLPPGAEALFPIDNAMYGMGRAVELTYARFPPETRKKYLDCLKAIYAAGKSS